MDFDGLIGNMGVKGKLGCSGDTSIFVSIGEGMYGMPLGGEMLQSFSGELGNMIAGSISTILMENNTEVMITTPTILQGNTEIFGYEKNYRLFLNKLKK